jgi:hypothetical protein
VGELLVDVAGWAGAILILGAYGLLTLKRIHGGSPAYLWMNLVGSVGFLINGAAKGAYPSAFLNLVWGVLTIYGLLEPWRRRRAITRSSASG